VNHVVLAAALVIEGTQKSLVPAGHSNQTLNLHELVNKPNDIVWDKIM
jgi:hypothetical protein